MTSSPHVYKNIINFIIKYESSKAYINYVIIELKSHELNCNHTIRLVRISEYGILEKFNILVPVPTLAPVLITISVPVPSSYFGTQSWYLYPYPYPEIATRTPIPNLVPVPIFGTNYNSVCIKMHIKLIICVGRLSKLSK